MKIQRICSWCRRVIGTVEWPHAVDDTPTHGICPECAAKELKAIKEAKRK